MIKKYKDFSINENVTEDEKYDIEQIVVELVQDMGFELEISKVFYSDNKREWRHDLNNVCNNPVFKIYLRNKKGVLDESSMESLLPSVYECVDRLSDLGESELIKFSLVRSYEKKDTVVDIIIMVAIDEEHEVSDLPGFYDFIDFLNRRWRELNNKVTRSFSIEERDKESVLLKNIARANYEHTGGATLSELKSLIKRIFAFSGSNRLGRKYEFDFKIEGPDLRIMYKGFRRIDHMGRLVD
jgi:hypothetical protein